MFLNVKFKVINGRVLHTKGKSCTLGLPLVTSTLWVSYWLVSNSHWEQGSGGGGLPTFTMVRIVMSSDITDCLSQQILKFVLTGTLTQ